MIEKLVPISALSKLLYLLVFSVCLQSLVVFRVHMSGMPLKYIASYYCVDQLHVCMYNACKITLSQQNVSYFLHTTNMTITHQGSIYWGGGGGRGEASPPSTPASPPRVFFTCQLKMVISSINNLRRLQNASLTIYNSKIFLSQTSLGGFHEKLPPQTPNPR